MGILSFLICLYFFGPYITRPGENVFVFGGDGLFIYFNMIFHSLHGEGLKLASMNHPNLDNIFMTDAQASISLMFNWLNNMKDGLGYQVIGFSNLLSLVSLIVASLFLFGICSELNFNTSLSIIAALLVCFLSPQLERITGGHIGLGYPHLIPMVLYWLIRENKPIWIHIFLVINIIFFGFNNIYLSLILTSIIAAYFFVDILTQRGISAYKLRHLIIGISPLVIIFISIKSLDYYNDRIAIPWGFFHHYSTIEGLFIGDQTITHKVISSYWNIRDISKESVSYLGLVPALFIIVIGIQTGIKKFRKDFKTIFNDRWNKITFSAFLVVVVLSSVFQLFENLDFHLLDLIFQFRTPGRFSWLLYYTLTICVIALLNHLWNSSGFIYKSIVILSLLIWAYEAVDYLERNTSQINGQNPYMQNRIEGFEDLCDAMGISRDAYHGIHLLPMTVGWSDKFEQKTFFGSYYNGFRYAVASGLPLTNALLSRISLSEAMDIIQISGNPFILKEKLLRLGSEKKILIIKGKDESITEHEATLMSLCESVGDDRRVDILDLDIKKYRQWYFNLTDSLLNDTSTLLVRPIYFETFDDRASEISLEGERAADYLRGEHVLFETNLKELNESMFEVSLWLYVDNDRFGQPTVTISELNSGNELKQKKILNPSESRDVFDGWVRVSTTMEPTASGSRVQIEVAYDRSFIVDQLMIRPLSENYIVPSEKYEKIKWYNNFPLTIN
jgi:hypothetical protein